MDPPPVSTHLRSQILAGADIDLSFLLPSVSNSKPHRTLDCGPIIINPKNVNRKSNWILTMTEFCIDFGRYTEIIYYVVPSRRKELKDFISIIAELSHSYGGTQVFLHCWSVSCFLCNSATHFSIPPLQAIRALIQALLNSSLLHLMYHILKAIPKAAISGSFQADKCVITSINLAALDNAANIYVYSM